MTREEAWSFIDAIIEKHEVDDVYVTINNHKDYDALRLARKLLEQEPKTGHWIDDKCSVCGKGIEDLISSSEWYRNEEPNFCPFCGVKLVEPQESERV